MPDSVKVSIIIVNFKTKELTLDCLKSVYDQCSGKSFEVILVDNNSCDGSVEAFRTQFPQVKLIELDINAGFAAANNLAARQARGEYLLLLNPDTVVLDDAVFRLVEFADKKPDAGIWGGRTLSVDGSLDPASCWRQLTLWGLFCGVTGLRALFPQSALFNSQAYGGWKRDTVREIDIVTGCFLLIRQTLWTKLGGFDPIFFMYGEDADLCLRAKALGYRPTITPDATIIHYCGGSEWIPARRHVQMLAANITLMERHWSRPKRVAGRILLTLHPYARASGYWILSVTRSHTRASKQLEIWRTVMEQKKKWISGFPAPTPV